MGQWQISHYSFDLAKSLAIPCFVTNCGEGLDYKAMGSIFSGLIHIGAWGCFDEFNRIELEVLSVVSTQLRTLLNAIKCKSEIFEFCARDISCDPQCGFFFVQTRHYDCAIIEECRVIVSEYYRTIAPQRLHIQIMPLSDYIIVLKQL